MTNLSQAKKKHHQQGAVLLEALIAVLIFSLGILALVGLQAAMIKNTGTSKYRLDASYIVQKRIGEMWADPASLASYVETNTDISTLIPGGVRTVTQLSPTQFQVTVGWTAPGEATGSNCGMTVSHCFTTVTDIAGA